MRNELKDLNRVAVRITVTTKEFEKLKKEAAKHDSWLGKRLRVRLGLPAEIEDAE